MSSSQRHRLGWILLAAVLAIGAIFVGSLLHGIAEGNKTAHRTDLADHTLDQHLVALAGTGATEDVATLPVASADADWDVVCWVDTGAWVGRAVADGLGIELTDITFEPRNFYVVDGYWGLAFYDRDSGLLRIIELGRHPVAEIDGPACLERSDARVAARPFDDGKDDIAVSFIGTSAIVQ